VGCGGKVRVSVIPAKAGIQKIKGDATLSEYHYRHSEGATRSGLRDGKKIFSGMQVESTATEESPVSKWQEGKILRRPIFLRQRIISIVGLLRMTPAQGLSL